MKVQMRRLVTAGIGAGVLTAYRNVKKVAKQNRPFRQRWEKHLLTTLEDLTEVAESGGELPFLYVALGDSAAQGLGAAHFGEGYVPRIAAGLEAVLQRPVAVLNISLSGGTAASVLGTQLPQLEGLRIAGELLRPDLVTLDIGGNDVGVAALTVDEFSEQMRRIMERLPHPAYVADIPTFRPLRTAHRASAMSSSIEEAARGTGVRVIHLEELSNTLTTTQYMVRYHASDMFHPNSPWYHRWSQLFMDAITEDLGVEPVDMASVGEFVPWVRPNVPHPIDRPRR